MKFAFLLFLLSFQLIAQPGNITKENATLETGTGSTPFIRATSKSLPEIKGTVYLNEEWEQASVTVLKEKKIVKLLARFNAYTQEIEILKEKDFVALQPVHGISVKLNGTTFVPFKAADSDKTVFAASLVDGKLSLFKVFDTKLIKAPSDASLLNIENQDRLKIVDKLYFRDKTGNIQVLPKNKKLVLAHFNKPTQEFIKKEKLSLKDENDLIKIFRFHNAGGTK